MGDIPPYPRGNEVYVSVAQSSPHNSNVSQQSTEHLSETARSTPQFEHPKKATVVFKCSLALALLFVGICAALPDQFKGSPHASAP